MKNLKRVPLKSIIFALLNKTNTTVAISSNLQKINSENCHQNEEAEI